MKTFVAVLMGLISGLCLCGMTGFALSGRSGGVGNMILLALFGGGIASGVLLRLGASTTATVAKRGFLLGAAEWVVIALVLPLVAVQSANTMVAQAGATGAEAVRLASGSGRAGLMGSGFALAMAAVCALCYFAVRAGTGRGAKDAVIAVPT